MPPELVEPDLLEVGDIIEEDDPCGGRRRTITWLARHGDWVSVDLDHDHHRSYNVHTDTVLRWVAAAELSGRVVAS